jgi:hypothetical protein
VTSTPTREPTPLLEPEPPNGEPRTPARPWKLLLLACLGLAVLSLLTPSTPTYDPWAWIIWGREIAHLDLSTLQGPSWKPLPVFFTTPFSLIGDGPAPELWLVVARTGGLFAFAMAYRLAARLAGPVAGVISAGSLILADEFIRNFARGNSEGILVALVLLALERHLDGRRRDAFLLGAAAALLRPELWPIWGLYGLWLIARDWRSDRPYRTVGLVLGSGAAVLLLWFVPEYIGSGEALRAAARARQPNPDSAAFASFPVLEVFHRSASILSVPVYVGAVAAVVRWWRDRREPIVPVLAVMSSALMIAVALMTQGGFAGNLRYVALPAAMVCILAGAGWVWLWRAVRERWGASAGALFAAAVVALFAPFVVMDLDELETGRAMVRSEADLYGANLKAAIAKAGGEEKLKRCGPIYTGPFQTQAVAWYLHLHENQVSIFPMPPGVALSPRFNPLANDPRFHRVTETTKWIVSEACRG